MSEFPSFDLGGQVALVTGAARGLGSAISKALAHAGADIVLGLRDVKTGDRLAREIGSLGPQGPQAPARRHEARPNRTRPESRHRAFRKTRHFGQQRRTGIDGGWTAR